MKVISIDSIDSIKVVGFDVLYVDSNGETQSYKDGLIDIAKGELSVVVNGIELDISEVVDVGENVAESLNNVFLDNAITGPSGETDKEKEEKEQETEKLLENREETEEQLEAAEQQLQERLEEIKRLEQELEEQKIEQEEKQKELEEQEEIIDLEALLPAVSAGESEKEEADSEENENIDDQEGNAVQSIPQPIIDEVTASRSSAPPTPASSESEGEEDEGESAPEEVITVDFSLANSSDSGQRGDFVTNVNNSEPDSALVFVGTSLAGASITLTLDGDSFTAVTSASGAWSITTTSFLNDGDYEVEVTATGLDGNEVSVARILTIDTVAPDAPFADLDVSSDTGDDNNDNLTNDTTPTFSGSAEPASTVTLTIDGLSYTSIAAEDGSWEVTVDIELADGEYEYTVIATDVAGNHSDPTTDVIIIDTENILTGGLDISSDTGTSSIDGITQETSPIFSGTGEAGLTVTLLLEVGSETFTYEAIVDDGGEWQIGPVDPLPQDGVYQYSLSSTDVAGNTTSLQQQFTLDTDISGLTARLDDTSNSASLEDTITNDNTPTFSGQSEAGATVELVIDSRSYSAIVDESGQWVLEVSDSLPDGIHEYSVTATDVAGNTESLTGLSVTIDTVVSTLSGGLSADSDSGQSSGDGITNVTLPTFSGEGEVGASVTLEINDQSFDAIVDVEGHWQIDLSSLLPVGLVDDVYDYTISSTDVAGNVASLPTQQLVVDTSAPLTVAGLTSDTNSFI